VNKIQKPYGDLLKDLLLPEDEQPYNIPTNWVWTKFGSVAKLYNGFAFKSTDYQEEGIPVIRISDISAEETSPNNAVRVPTDLFNERFLVKKGDLLIAMSGATTGKTGIYNSDEVALQNQRVGNIKEISDKVLYSKYKNYFVYNNSKEILKRAYGGAQPNISGTLIEELSFPLPPLNEQKRVANKVEYLLSKVDEAKRLIEDAKETFELRRSTILDKAFRGGLTAKWRKENNTESNTNDIVKNETLLDGLFKIPSSWTWNRIGDTFHVQVGSTPSRKETMYWNGDLPWLSSGEVAFNRITESREKVTNIAVTEKRLKLAPKGSILFGMIGEGKTRGQVALLDIDAYHNQNVASIWVSKTEHNPLFVYYWLLSQYSYNRMNSAGNNQPAYNKARVENLILPLPPIEEQNEIIKILDNIFQNENATNQLLQVNHSIEDITNAILHKAFRGELGTNDPNEESALELLKEILSEKVGR
jgi:type I restriction enzyme, S subunit